MLSPGGGPADLGFLGQRLRSIPAAFATDVTDGKLAGAVMLVARDSKIVLFEAVGFRDVSTREPMPKDAIFRLASLTKPVTSVAALTLAEAGSLDLMWPVHRLVSGFKTVRVGEAADAASGTVLKDSVPLHPPRIWDLLRHTSGLTYGVFGTSAVKDTYVKAGVLDRNQTSADVAAKLAALPLAYHPGTIWDYGMSTDLLGHLVELISGMDLGSFVESRIAGPLGLETFGYWIPEAKRGRVAQAAGGEAGSTVLDPVPTACPTWAMGGGGMVATALDYAKFAQMLLDGGRIGSQCVLSRKTVELMTSDQLPRGLPRDRQFLEIMSDLAPAEEYAQSFGLGVAVRTGRGPSPIPGSVGDFFWQGITGPYFWVDPTERLVCVLMIQVPFYRTDRYRRMFRRLVYAALTGT